MDDLMQDLEHGLGNDLQHLRNGTETRQLDAQMVKRVWIDINWYMYMYIQVFEKVHTTYIHVHCMYIHVHTCTCIACKPRPPCGHIRPVLGSSSLEGEREGGRGGREGGEGGREGREGGRGE